MLDSTCSRDLNKETSMPSTQSNILVCNSGEADELGLCYCVTMLGFVCLCVCTYLRLGVP